MKILNTLTLKNLKLNKKRTIVTIIGISLSVALICAITTFTVSIQKAMIEVGDISIKGVVTKNTQDPRNNLECLQNTPLNRVMQMADFTSSGIYDVIRYL